MLDKIIIILKIIAIIATNVSLIVTIIAYSYNFIYIDIELIDLIKTIIYIQ